MEHNGLSYVTCLVGESALQSTYDQVQASASPFHPELPNQLAPFVASYKAINAVFSSSDSVPAPQGHELARSGYAVQLSKQLVPKMTLTASGNVGGVPVSSFVPA
jgi:hypothetical protein